ncbi:MAG: Gfo/Idh/MocA family oxidoreductase [Roseobacter sp.]|jgi:predicted dehydrogenase|nr:Gfo/Idh/MocA family oxidoreductase [Roseobacter sp.]
MTETEQYKRPVVMIGTGFVADLYIRSQELHPTVEIIGAFDIRPGRLAEFCAYWKLRAFDSLQAALEALPENGLVLNLTSPAAHYEVSRACLEAGRHVYSEKPLATEFDKAQDLVALAQARGLQLGGAPCSYLSEAAMTLAEAVRTDVCGTVRLIYAEMDDGYIPQAPYDKWFSESGAPWPYEDEMRTGCTLEHAGYVLTWMIAIFGPIKTITAFSAPTIDKGLDPECSTPDTSIGILHFESGPILRLTITIVAPHNHELLVTGDKGTLEIKDTWNNYARILFRKRLRIRRRLLESPIAKRLRFGKKQSGARASRRGSSTMDYFLGPVELLEQIHRNNLDRYATDLALHTTEATLALQNAGAESTFYRMQSRCEALPYHLREERAT